MTVHQGDCRDVMRTMDADSIDSIVSDPPYGLSFMGKGWDRGVPSVEFWVEALRVAKPGAHLLAFGGTRTFHRLAVAIEDAGWEIRDTVMWVYGSGFPKSLDVSKAIDKAAGFATDAVRQWDGWGTALKPAWEPIIVARKPLIGTVAENVLTHGTGAINVDGCRVGADGGGTHCTNRNDSGKCCGHDNAGRSTSGQTFHGPDTSGGRWPANLIHDGSDEVVARFPQTTSMQSMRGDRQGGLYDGGWSGNTLRGHNDTGSAARFFYCAKASKTDRNEGLNEFQTVRTGCMSATVNGSMLTSSGNERTTTGKNNHPTVKPTALMRYLCKLVTPPNGIILDPFMGSGSTGKAATLEGFRFVGIDLSQEYCDIAKARIQAATPALWRAV